MPTRCVRTRPVLCGVLAVALLALAGCGQTHHSSDAVGPLLLPPGVHAVEDLTRVQLASLPRDRTLFLLPVGMVEEHGPHLPAGTDNVQLDAEMQALLPALAQRLPGWYVLSLPSLPYGVDGANGLSGDPIDPGTYALQPGTLKAVVRDLGTEVAQNGFRWTFVVYTHGAPDHAKAIFAACDEVSDKYRVTMANLSGTMWADPARVKEADALRARFFTPPQLALMQHDFHAGANETSLMLAEAPARVSPAWRGLPAIAGDSMLAILKQVRRTGWAGYIGAPAFSNVRYGREKLASNVKFDVALVAQAVAGDNLRKHPRD
jgi:creatinine amidohydrolase